MRALIILLCLYGSMARAELCNPALEQCWDRMFRSASSSPAKPTTSSTVRINPSAVPLEKGFGAEMIHYKGEIDFALVQGLGRVGAAISPSASEETFFGPPAIEYPTDYLDRQELHTKYKSQKLTLATAINLFSNHSKDLKRLELNLGVMGKMNRTTGTVTPGGGLTAVAGPFTFGYSRYSDQTQLEAEPILAMEQSRVDYQVEMYSAGLYLNTLALDYSVMHQFTTNRATISLATASLLLKYGIFTLSLRNEESDRPVYNQRDDTVSWPRQKSEIFGGAQFALGSHFMLGAFYNYYVLHEISLGATIFL
jgi:hypothetical protein